jgi:hypothetical protein
MGRNGGTGMPDTALSFSLLSWIHGFRSSTAFHNPCTITFCTSQDQNRAHGAWFWVLQVKTDSPLAFSTPSYPYLIYGVPGIPHIHSVHFHLDLQNLDRKCVYRALFSFLKAKPCPHLFLSSQLDTHLTMTPPWLHKFTPLTS